MLARVFSGGGVVWIFLACFAAGMSWAGLAFYRMVSPKRA